MTIDNRLATLLSFTGAILYRTYTTYPYRPHGGECPGESS
jgi:hypothetical protein